MTSLARKITNILHSKVFFWVIVGGFILQGVLFALVVSPSTVEIQSDGSTSRTGGVVPDGNRHIGAIYYFASQPLSNGPIIHDMSEHDLWMGDLERFPSYFYYYLMSFPVRIATTVGLPDAATVIMIRLIGILFGVIVLLTLRKIVLDMGLGRTAANLAVLSMAVTGSFVWLTPAENYDVLALMFWMLFVLASLRLFIRRDGRYLYWMALWFFLVGITKYTYIPFAGLSGIVALYLYARSVGYVGTWLMIQKQWRTWRKELTKYQVAALAVLVLVPAVLFIERVGGNLLFYRSFNPSCSQIHAYDACMSFGVFERNKVRAQEYDRQLESGEVEPITYQPIEYTKFWLNRYYSSMYGYVGHIWIYDFWPLMYAGMFVIVGMAVSLLVFLKYRRQKLLQTSAEKYLVGIIVMLIVAQYIFNLRTFITFGGEMYAYAHQGRYLLSAIGLLYVIVLAITLRAFKLMSRRTRRIVVPLFVIGGLFALITNCALVSFFVHADTIDWYSGIGQQILPDWLYRIN